MNIGEAIGKVAGGAITKHRFVKLSTADANGETVVQGSVSGESCYGVSLFSVSTAEIALGKGCSVILGGRMILEGAEAIVAGNFVSSDAQGRAQVANSGDFILGICDEPCAGAGDECSVHLNMAGATAA